VLPLARWRWLGSPKGFGIAFEPQQVSDDDIAELAKAPLLVIVFAKFTDGRGYSLARRLRDTHNYKGELRASGDVLLDQLDLMARCGFDSFEISHEPTIDALERGHMPRLSTSYQAAHRNARTIRPTLQRAAPAGTTAIQETAR
jgi:uncharacterized protein (DUF934 family)